MEIPVSNMDHPALVDPEDYSRVIECRWYCTDGETPVTGDWSEPQPHWSEKGHFNPFWRPRKMISMARFVLGLGKDQRAKFVNGNPWDCRRDNMLVVRKGYPPVRPECIPELNVRKRRP